VVLGSRKAAAHASLARSLSNEDELERFKVWAL
jgi:hypothetical protein